MTAPPTPSARNWLARRLYPFGSIRKVLAGPARGLRFHVAPGMGVSYALGRDHREAHDRLAARIRENETVIDVGANQGQFALLLAKLTGVKGRVLALEPVPHNFLALQANLDLNDCAQVTALQVAAGSESGVRTFLHDEQRGTMGTFASSAVKLTEECPSIEVETETIDRLCAVHGVAPRLIKIDVEGAAGDVLAGATGTIREHRPRLFVELHMTSGQDREREAVRWICREFGYRVEMLDHQPFEAPRAEGEYHAWCDPVR